MIVELVAGAEVDAVECISTVELAELMEAAEDTVLPIVPVFTESNGISLEEVGETVVIVVTTLEDDVSTELDTYTETDAVEVTSLVELDLTVEVEGAAGDIVLSVEVVTGFEADSVDTEDDLSFTTLAVGIVVSIEVALDLALVSPDDTCDADEEAAVTVVTSAEAPLDGVAEETLAVETTTGDVTLEAAVLWKDTCDVVIDAELAVAKCEDADTDADVDADGTISLDVPDDAFELSSLAVVRVDLNTVDSTGAGADVDAAADVETGADVDSDVDFSLENPTIEFSSVAVLTADVKVVALADRDADTDISFEVIEDDCVLFTTSAGDS